jgi:hypothetical protein
MSATAHADEEVGSPMSDRIRHTPPHTPAGAEGFALILAMLALMLLTTLGIALSLTTTTEVQIAANYKWSQQALYNAEAGLEAGKAILSRIPGEDWTGIMPGRRNEGWTMAEQKNAPPAPVDSSAERNFENGGCDSRGAGVGYGTVLSHGGTRWENVSSVGGERLPGAFTLWIRRPVVLMQASAADGSAQYTDYSEDNGTAILTAEGTAPFQGSASGSAFLQENRSVRILEMKVTLINKDCMDETPQAGHKSLGTNVFTCARSKDPDPTVSEVE